MISLSNVSKAFGAARAVDDVSLEVAPGGHLVLLGTSGCGKTTTLKMINRLIEPDSGAIVVNGKNIDRQSPEQLRRGIGYVLQRNSLFPHYTVAQNIAVVPQMLRWDKSKTNARTQELLHKLHLSQSFLSAYPHQLSGGEAQRVNLARALVADPPVLLMDEPFSALDTITRSAIRKEFRELDEFKKKTTIMVTHDVQEAFELGDVICLMQGGRVVQSGTPSHLLFRPANDFVRSFLADDYLQLALMVTKLGDIWPSLTDEVNSSGNDSEKMTADNTVWAAMERLSGGNAGGARLSLRQPETGEAKSVSWQGLLLAFSKHQTPA